MKELLSPHCTVGQRVPCTLGSIMLAKPKLSGKEANYAVFHWFNYRKEQSACCHHLFEEYEDALIMLTNWFIQEGNNTASFQKSVPKKIS